MHTIVLGLGNPIRSDDGIGCRVVREVERRLSGWVGRNVEIESFYRGGIALMERLIGYEKAILVDSIEDLSGVPGTLRRLTLDDLPKSNHVDSPHDTSFKAALEMGRRLGAELPTEIVIFGVGIVPTSDFSEELSPEVAGSVEPTVRAVLEEIGL
ncbi:MAG TPA: hydrogenase maturation protease [Thermodesulfobacteriota bacterium]|nr:hydrogenase maturation protease [Thermodesulfobacteriota bacterium]